MSPSVPRRRRSERLIATTPVFAIGGGAVLLTGLIWLLPGQRDFELTETLPVFMLFVVLADLLEVPLERGRAFSLGLAPGLAYALLRDCPSGDVATSCLLSPTVGQVVLVVVVGSCFAIALRWLINKKFNPSLVAARVLIVAAAGGAYRAVADLSDDLSFGPARVSVLGLATVLFLVSALEIALESLLEADNRSSLKRLTREKTREVGPLLLSTVSVAALLSLAYPVLGPWTVPLFLAPLAATQFSFRQVQIIRRNSLQTVRALAKVPEMAGYTHRGHSARVATLSVQIAEELGVVQPELHDIEYGALLHDIGTVSVPDPEDVSTPTSQMELAVVGAEIVEKTGHFQRVGKMIGMQHEPYRRRGEDTNRSLPLGAKIIKVASAYDDLTEPPGPGRTPWEALERLHLEMAYEYDPHVIQALTHVLERGGLV